MPHIAIEIFYFIAFGLFLLGSAFSFRDNGSTASVAIMSCGVAADLIVRLLSVGGFTSLPESTGGANIFIERAVTFGMLAVLPGFLVALLVLKRGRTSFFHALIAGIELVWFLDIIVLLYGLYAVVPGS